MDLAVHARSSSSERKRAFFLLFEDSCDRLLLQGIVSCLYGGRPYITIK